jgi:predicted RNA-binding Zn-ribbon protein involved in translation (DUF1610 family)
MPICPDCGREIAEVTSCTRQHFQLGNKLMLDHSGFDG